jgi:hypothetical protein
MIVIKIFGPTTPPVAISTKSKWTPPTPNIIKTHGRILRTKGWLPIMCSHPLRADSNPTAVGLLTRWTKPARPTRPVRARHAVQASTISYCPAHAVCLYDIHGGTSSTSPTQCVLVCRCPGTGACAIHGHLASRGLPCQSWAIDGRGGMRGYIFTQSTPCIIKERRAAFVMTTTLPYP